MAWLGDFVKRFFR